METERALKEFAISKAKLRKLDKLERDVISLFYFDRLSNDAIAERLNLQKRYILKIKSRALSKLA